MDGKKVNKKANPEMPPRVEESFFDATYTKELQKRVDEERTEENRKIE